MKIKNKIKHKIISILVIIITIINISGISSASVNKEEIETNTTSGENIVYLENSKKENIDNNEKLNENEKETKTEVKKETLENTTEKKDDTTKELGKIEEIEKQEKEVKAQEIDEVQKTQEITKVQKTKSIAKNLEEEVIEETNVEILNQDKETKEHIQGNIFAILNEDDTVFKENLQTNEEGKINFTLPMGKYYLKQTSTIEGYNLNKALIEIDTSNAKNINIKIESTKPTTNETTVVNKEINIIEEHENIVENNIKNVADYNITNINKEIINETNRTNLNNVNNFINTINRENIAYITKENFYRNNIDEDLFTTTMKALGNNVSFSKSREDYVNYMDMIMMNSTRVPLLPIASR